jgi:hypothetical protein
MPYLKDPQFKSAPDVLSERKAWFAALVEEAWANDCWVNSLAGAPEVTIECLPSYALAGCIARARLRT